MRAPRYKQNASAESRLQHGASSLEEKNLNSIFGASATNGSVDRAGQGWRLEGGGEREEGEVRGGFGFARVVCGHRVEVEAGIGVENGVARRRAAGGGQGRRGQAEVVWMADAFTYSRAPPAATRCRPNPTGLH
jgi:hypothetical protein